MNVQTPGTTNGTAAVPNAPRKVEALQVSPLLELRSVSKSFGAVNALRNVSLSLYPGRVTALVGDNGAGKSTLVKTLTGVHSPDSGEILFDGKAVRFSSPKEAAEAGIATVFQDLAVCGNLSVAENLFLGRELTTDSWNPLRALRRTRVAEMERKSRELLASLNAKVPSLRNAVETLSGGQRQSVAIARALLGEPRVVILDEPTAALSVGQTAEVLAMIERLRDAGMAILVISHNLADVFRVADDIAVLRLGANSKLFEAKTCSQEQVIAAITGAQWAN
ncbi:ATP-binding cassette domain-containing protein [Caballeronia mineralivorans]|uniref:ATP-binding cassette domain-containing protein n=1 Tax=Caballeronia mineralivorans TaxID=2010198 RepID=UPI0009E23C4F|nr:ATP-binding cassette domain-containing protein [Caballeronia mineralivorans]